MELKGVCHATRLGALAALQHAEARLAGQGSPPGSPSQTHPGRGTLRVLSRPLCFSIVSLKRSQGPTRPEIQSPRKGGGGELGNQGINARGWRENSLLQAAPARRPAARSELTVARAASRLLRARPHSRSRFKVVGSR